jgi:hypothetical protein
MKTCVVVARNETARCFLAAALKSMRMEAVLLDSLGELSKTLESVSVCGILLELTTSITASPAEKRAMQEFAELYPFAKFKLAGDEILIVGETMAGFVERCRQFNPRKNRNIARKEVFQAVYLCADERFEDAEQSVSSNSSERGWFVYSVREWNEGCRAWLRFSGEEKVICGSVRSVRPWGSSKQLPGICFVPDSGQQYPH